MVKHLKKNYGTKLMVLMRSLHSDIRKANFNTVYSLPFNPDANFKLIVEIVIQYILTPNFIHNFTRYKHVM